MIPINVYIACLLLMSVTKLSTEVAMEYSVHSEP